jgi:predicted AAA+ superfamily ATPase
MTDETLLSIMYENQNRLARVGGIRRTLHSRLLAAFPSRPIKVVIGFRRSGKSWLCMQIARELGESGAVPPENILFLNFEDYRVADIRSPAELDRALRLFAARIATPGPRLLVLDEIQAVPGWETFLRSVHERNDDWDILATGSNSELLSSEFAGKLAGRHIAFELLPFSFSEIVAYRGIRVRDEAEYHRRRPELEKVWNEFITLGGLPERLTVSDPQAVRSYQEGIVAKVILDDVIKRFKVEQVTALERLLSFLLASPGQIVSYATLARHLSTLGTTVKADTVIRYVSYLKAAFALFDLSRFDWKQGRHFDTTRKYYSIDTGIASLYRPAAENRAFLIENAVYLELRRRGLKLNFGALENGRELDFLARRDDRSWLKIQVSRRLDSENRGRELSAFLQAEPFLSGGEWLLLVEEGERDEISVEGVRIRIEPILRWALGV